MHVCQLALVPCAKPEREMEVPTWHTNPLSVGVLGEGRCHSLPVLVDLLDWVEPWTEASIERPSRMHPCRHVFILGGFDQSLLWSHQSCSEFTEGVICLCLLWRLGMSGSAGQVVEALGARLTTVAFRDEVEKSMKCLGVKGCPATIHYTISCSVSWNFNEFSFFLYLMCG